MKSLLQNILTLLDKVASTIQPIFLLIIRLYFGYSFAMAGYGKFMNFERTVGFFSSIGIPAPELNVVMAAGTELIGGVLILIGLFTRPASFFLTFTMCVAYATAHPEALTDINKFFSEGAFPFLYTSLILFFFGAGKLSLDSRRAGN